MKTKLHLLLFFFALAVKAQVGVNTTTPNSQLDIRSSNQAAPANTDGILIPKVDVFPAINPTAAQQGMLVYLTTAVGPKMPGFYYWDNPTLTWIGFGGTVTSDADWYEQGTTVAPDAITDNMFHMGNVAIGKNTTAYPLEIANSAYGNNIENANSSTLPGLKIGVHNTMSSTAGGISVGTYNSVPSNSGFQYGTVNEMNGTGPNQHFGTSSVLSGAGTGQMFGSYSEITNSGNATHYGTFNSLSGTGSGFHYGIYSELTGTGTGQHIGINNVLSGSGAATYYAIQNDMIGSGTGPRNGILNDINVTNNSIQTGVINFMLGGGTGDRRGVFNGMTGATSGDIQGIYNSVASTGDGSHYGNYNLLTGSGIGSHYGSFSSLSGAGSGNQIGSYQLIGNSGNGLHYAVYNWLTGTGTGTKYGLFNQMGATGGNQQAVTNNMTGAGAGTQYGVWNTIANTGNGIHYGINNSLSGTGTGTKYANYNFIATTAGGTGYGVYSDVLKAGSYAGYFLGSVAIGTSGLNTYTMPSSRGTNLQIMQTDGAGNVGWRDMTTAMNNAAWLTTGNTGLSSANYLGTADAVPIIFKSAGTERMRINPADGEIVAGATASPYPGDLFATVSTAALTFGVNGYTSQNGSGVWGETLPASTSGFSSVQGVYTGTGVGSGVFGNYDGTNNSNTRSGVTGYNDSTANGGAGVYGYFGNGSTLNNQHMGVLGAYYSGTYGIAVYGIGFGGGIITGNVDAAVVGWRASNQNYSGYFNGNHVIANGTKSASVGTSKGNQLLYVTETPGVWFEDIGRGNLTNGSVEIKLDPLFLETVAIDDRHPMSVFLQEEGESNGLYVIPGKDGFTVKEKNGGTSNIAFSYRIMAKRLNFQDHRFGNDPVWGAGDTRKYNQYATPPPVDYTENVRFQEEQKRNYKPTPMPEGFVSQTQIQQETEKLETEKPKPQARPAKQ